MKTKILIVGAGLSGLVVGYGLKKAGIPFLILEARDRVGGRIYTKNSVSETPVEMGATWFVNQHTILLKLLKELGLKYFEQFMSGTSFLQPLLSSPAKAITIPNQSSSYRISGGTSYLIETLIEYIGKDNILLGEKVTNIDFLEDSVVVKTEKLHTATKVVLALPPKLWSNNIKFSPSLPVELKDIALTTHTWMESSIKIALTYKQPFWRDKKQSGTFFSSYGPITELYDHCNSKENKYALGGFIHLRFKNMSAAERKNSVIKHITSVFGNQANDFIDYNEVVWNNENETFSENIASLYPHQNNGNLIFKKNHFKNRLLISSAEASEISPGYMDGAVNSANFVVEKIKADNDIHEK